MVNSRPQLNSRSQFDNFLFAKVGDDERGMAVSVLSAFARLDFDPWNEAAELAQLPIGVAEARLGTTIAALQGVTPSTADTGATATRLLGLLPGRATTAILSREARVGDTIESNLRSPSFLIPIILLTALAFASQFFTSSVERPSMVAAPTTQAQDPLVAKLQLPALDQELSRGPTDPGGH